MELEELKRKAKNKEIKLEDLDAEDILKFSSDSFLNPALKRYFDLPDSEIKRISKEKGLDNADLENFIRELIVIYNFINTKYPSYSVYFVNVMIPDMTNFFGGFKGKQENYFKRVMDIDWQNMDPKEEIKKRNIDVPFREKQLEKLIFGIETEILKIQEANIINEENINPIYKEKYHPQKKAKKAKRKNNGEISQRDKTVKIRALQRANYLCEIDNSHKTFISKSNGKPFMQGHHLIPLEYEYLFPYSLDVEANVVCLCSHCHDEIHYGVNYKKLISKLYEERKEDLKKCGIEIKDIKLLYDMYDRIRIKEML